MAGQAGDLQSKNADVTIEAVERVLAVGRLLLSVLTPEDLEQIQVILAVRQSPAMIISESGKE